MSITFGKPRFVDDEEQEIEKYTYLTLYGSGFVRPKEKSMIWEIYLKKLQ